MKIKIIAVGKENSKLAEEFSKEYIKRMPWKVEVIEVEPSKKKSVDEMKMQEASLIMAKSKSSSYKILMDETGVNLTSEEFAEHINKIASNGNSEIEFWIGGANGHGKEIKQVSDYKLSLSNMTFPHKLARMVLIEQIYRAYTLSNNHPYHK